jgi:GNAT superfamily N-acetyltransferase
MNIAGCQESDKGSLWKMLHAYLTEVDGDLLPTDKNIRYFADLAIQGAAVGDPCLIAYVEGVPVGFHISRGLPDVLDTKLKICHGYGTYVIPTFRGRGIARALRELAFETAVVAGYERLEGIAFSKEAMLSTLTHGSKPIGVLIVRDKET